jgi:hypothetical protein
VVAGRDPRSLGSNEKVAKDPGISPEQAVAMQQIAFEQIIETEKL